MVKKSLVVITALALVGTLCIAVVLAATEAPTEDLELTVEGATRPLIVKFGHEKHKAYACSECHHIFKPDDKGEYPKDKRGKYKKELENFWKEGDEVQACSDCHKLEDDKKAKKEMKIGKNQVRSLEDAFHGNCVDCHKAYNKKNKLKGDDKLVSTCNDCHEKAKK